MCSINGCVNFKDPTRVEGTAVAAAGARLEAVSPFSIMQRGYAMAMDEKGTPVTSAKLTEIGQALQVRMKDGILMTTVTGKKVFDGGEKETDI